MSKIKFRKQYQPVGFGDKPSGQTVDGRRIAARKAAETRDFNRMVKERQEAEKMHHGRVARVLKFLGWLFSHMKFRDNR